MFVPFFDIHVNNILAYEKLGEIEERWWFLANYKLMYK